MRCNRIVVFFSGVRSGVGGSETREGEEMLVESPGAWPPAVEGAKALGNAALVAAAARAV